jgi:hypothetical protein
MHENVSNAITNAVDANPDLSTYSCSREKIPGASEVQSIVDPVRATDT